MELEPERINIGKVRTVYTDFPNSYVVYKAPWSKISTKGLKRVDDIAPLMTGSNIKIISILNNTVRDFTTKLGLSFSIKL